MEEKYEAYAKELEERLEKALNKYFDNSKAHVEAGKFADKFGKKINWRTFEKMEEEVEGVTKGKKNLRSEMTLLTSLHFTVNSKSDFCADCAPLPLCDWWSIKENLTVEDGSGCCKSVTLSSTGAAAKEWPSHLGTYEATEEKHNGEAIYRNFHGIDLFRESDGTWHASSAIRGVGTGQCPENISQWEHQYNRNVRNRNGGIDKRYSGDITAKCT